MHVDLVCLKQDFPIFSAEPFKGIVHPKIVHPHPHHVIPMFSFFSGTQKEIFPVRLEAVKFQNGGKSNWMFGVSTFFLKNRFYWAWNWSNVTVKTFIMLQMICISNQLIRMISEGSCDTEDWSNDAENAFTGISQYLPILLFLMYFFIKWTWWA